MHDVGCNVHDVWNVKWSSCCSKIFFWVRFRGWYQLLFRSMASDQPTSSSTETVLYWLRPRKCTPLFAYKMLQWLWSKWLCVHSSQLLMTVDCCVLSYPLILRHCIHWTLLVIVSYTWSISTYMHKITNLWKCERSCERTMEEKTPLSHKLCAFRCLETLAWGLEFNSNILVKVSYFRVSHFSQCFILSTALHCL